VVQLGEALLTMDVLVTASDDLAQIFAQQRCMLRSRPQYVRGSGACQWISDRADVLGFFALLAGHSVELDALALFEALVTVALNVGEMYEDVITLLARDESESLFCIEKLHCTLCHEYSILKTTDRPIRFARH
jgi:hypothetical protein